MQKRSLKLLSQFITFFILIAVSSFIFFENKVSHFDYTGFANNMATQAESLIPDDISTQNKTYIIEKIRKNTSLTGQYLAKDSEYKFSNEQIMLISQVEAEWTFHKSIDLARSGIPAQYWDDILQRISFTIYEIAKQATIKQIPQEQMLQAVEYHVVKVYKQSIKELEQKGLIDKATKNKAESQSNIDAMAKQAQNIK